MNIKDTIRCEIINHLLKYNLVCKPELIESMVETNKYAFQIIYNEKEVIRFKPLNHKDVRIEKNEFNTLYSYDGGVRFQWFEKETILIDISEIRDVKLNKLL